MTYDRGTVAPDVGNPLPDGGFRGDTSSATWWADSGPDTDAFFASLAAGDRWRCEVNATAWVERVQASAPTKASGFWTLATVGGGTEGPDWWTLAGGEPCTVSKVAP
jgi:hypothetical protein